MEDFWAVALWGLKVWFYLVVALIMVPAMFGFSLGISETYMTILVRTLEVGLLAFNFLCMYPPSTKLQQTLRLFISDHILGVTQTKQLLNT